MPRIGEPGGSTPISRRQATASGISPSPQALSIGGWKRSRTVARIPARRARMAVASPAGPPPMINRSSFITAPPHPRVRQTGAGHGPGQAQGGDGLGRPQLAREPEAQGLLAAEL